MHEQTGLAYHNRLDIVFSHVLSALQGNDVDIRIKWPNDIYSNGMKIGGVLCHSTYREKDFHVVIGVGLNLDNSQPTTCVNDIIQRRLLELQLSPGMQPITREVLVKPKNLK